MHGIVWEFEIKPERAVEFVAAYAPNGAWAQLFSQAEGYQAQNSSALRISRRAT